MLRGLFEEVGRGFEQVALGACFVDRRLGRFLFFAELELDRAGDLAGLGFFDA